MAPGMMGAGGMMHDGMGPGMKDSGTMGAGPGMIGGPGAMRMMMILMDADGDGALSLEEVQAVHARLFKAIDADGNGRVTVEEVESFISPGGQGAAHR
ncbi:MAG: EF-hand domain-containing protein [Amaricoccus sp.]